MARAPNTFRVTVDTEALQELRDLLKELDERVTSIREALTASSFVNYPPADRRPGEGAKTKSVRVHQVRVGFEVLEVDLPHFGGNWPLTLGSFDKALKAGPGPVIAALVEDHLDEVFATKYEVEVDGERVEPYVPDRERKSE